jgi:hypothetical protein
MRKYNLVIFIICFLAASCNSYGQQIGKRISHTTLSIFNNSEEKMAIKLGLQKTDLTSYTIAAQEQWISPTFPAGAKPFFILKAKNKERHYTLKLNTAYMIYWNNKKNYWDLKQVKV